MTALTQCAAVRFSLLFDGRCLTADEAGDKCGVRLAPCTEGSESSAALQAWRLVLDNVTGLYTVTSPARELMDGKAPGTCVDEIGDCGYWAASGECTTNPVYMLKTCPLSCGVTTGSCRPKPACTSWSHRIASQADRQHDPSAIGGHPLLSLAPPHSSKLLQLRLDLWSDMFSGYYMVRAECPAVRGVACCLESGLWSLGPRNAKVTNAHLQLCTFHEAAMFPFQQWAIGCAVTTTTRPRASETAGQEDFSEQHGRWLEQLTEREGGASLERLLPYEALGVHEFATLDEAKGAFRRLSREFHPDKSRSVHAPLIFEAL